ncbi:ABC transporter permease [Tepidanaerobacter acetatoxydans]|uniref:ABC transporter permease n=1 Tax=Tepidanaerobacter acetatoxydans TaxID=499229 RepID=UPI003B5A4E62
MRYQKVLKYFVTFFCIITLNFFLPRIMPGDPFYFLSSEQGEVTVTYSQEEIDRFKAYYGLDKPVLAQYGSYLNGIIKGDLGYSIYFGSDVKTIIKNRIPWSVSLVLLSVIIGGGVGTLLGCLSAWYRGNASDKILYSIMVVISEIPAFLIGIFFLFYLAARQGIFPLSGGAKPFADYASWADAVLDILYHGFLPTLTLSVVQMGGFYLIARNSMITVMSKDYIITAKAKGLSTGRILFCHALSNAALPIATQAFYSLGQAVGGTLLVENVFKYPGLGSLMRQAVMVRDYPLIQGIFLTVTFFVLIMNAAVDILYKKLDPRIT